MNAVATDETEITRTGTEIVPNILITRRSYHVDDALLQSFKRVESAFLDSGLPSRTILDRTYSAQRFFIFIYLFIYFGSCGRLSWLNCQLSNAR